MSNALFERVVAKTGLPSVVGAGTVERALSAIGVPSVDAAGPEEYRRALPQLRARMTLYLKPDKVEEQLREIEALLF
jgi:hypothetical protein